MDAARSGPQGAHLQALLTVNNERSKGLMALRARPSAIVMPVGLAKGYCGFYLRIDLDTHFVIPSDPV